MNTELNAKLIALLIRHAITAVGAVGMFSENDLEKLASAVAIIVGLAWSIIEKRAKTGGDGGSLPPPSLPPTGTVTSVLMLAVLLWQAPLHAAPPSNPECPVIIVRYVRLPEWQPPVSAPPGLQTDLVLDTEDGQEWVLEWLPLHLPPPPTEPETSASASL